MASGDLAGLSGAGSAYAGAGSDGENAVTALMTLGYTKAVAVNAVGKAIESGAKTLEDIIAGALRSLG